MAEKFELREIEWTAARALAVILALATAGIHLAIATMTGQKAFAVLGMGVLAGIVVYFTELWEPVFYLVGALYLGAMSVIWLLTGMPQLLFGLADKVVQGALFVLLVYLLVTESGETEAESSG